MLYPIPYQELHSMGVESPYPREIYKTVDTGILLRKKIPREYL